MAESAAVNRVVVGSNPTRGAKILPSLIGRAIDSGSIRSSFESKGRSHRYKYTPRDRVLVTHCPHKSGNAGSNPAPASYIYKPSWRNG